MSDQENKDANKERTLQELSRRNAEIFNLAIREQNAKIVDMQSQINGLLNTISVLQDRLNQQDQRIGLLQYKIMGTGPTK